MSDELTVRRYRPGETDRIETVMEAAHRAADAWIPGVDDHDSVVDGYFSDGELLVGTVDGKIVGTIAYRTPGDLLRELLDDVDTTTAQLERFNVLPEYQREGHGTRLYEELERRARADGYEELVLHTTHRQTAAQHFYRVNGFREVCRVEVTRFARPFELLCYRTSIDDSSPFDPYPV
ncbi:GNAT family N-acetyltransferase [Natranaeroarchaeum sulfidigenes]|uniref:Acetyltransferase (GNAT) family n=1 Tax=Natranaeroarchaeum sulfidigenes TaxID=2784880 RepID=A0A897MLY7_9EURY|nr:GNAT family N-acetyltransferase [Natranaeroarchaeum sulfidigenes]QSG01381.1 Acetyltransferase (GNAT) family [Natranaeroarchaeum sulfidigenes]